jgi:hypothetical protein
MAKKVKKKAKGRKEGHPDKRMPPSKKEAKRKANSRQQAKPPEVREQENPKKEPKKLTRIEACVRILLGGGEFDRGSLIQAADDYYVKHGGTSNLKESEWSYRHSFATLRAAGMIEQVGDKFQLKK